MTRSAHTSEIHQPTLMTHVRVYPVVNTPPPPDAFHFTLPRHEPYGFCHPDRENIPGGEDTGK